MKKKKNGSGAKKAVREHKKEKKKENRGGGKERGKKKREGEGKRKKGFFASLKDLRKSGCRFSLEQEVKSVHVTRAMRGYQNLGVSSNSKTYKIFLL